MAQFIHLAEVCVNLETIRYVVPRTGRVHGDRAGCTVCFVGSPEPHAFYGEDAEKLLAFVHDHTLKAISATP